MATEIISTSLTTPYLLDKDDDLIVTGTGSLIVDEADAIHTRSNLDTDLSILVLGHVEATGLASPGLGASAVFLGGTFTNGAFDPSNNMVTVGITGSLEALGGFGIVSLGSATQVTNFGTIDADSGIVLRGGDNQILNTGAITATSVGISISGTDSAPKSDASLIHNSGTIQVSAGAGILVQERWVTVINDGSIAGGIGVQSSHASVWNTGTITQTTSPAVSFSAASGTLTNTGTISGQGSFATVEAMDGLKILNSGLIESDRIAIGGSIRSAMNDGIIAGGLDGISVGSSDRFDLINSGLIEGSQYGVFHSLGLRSHILNLGTISGLANGASPGYSIFTDQVAGKVDNQGTLLGDVFVGFGRLTNDGTITGDVTLGFGKLANHGVIDGDVFLLDSNIYRSGSSGSVTGSINGSGGLDRLFGGDLSDRMFGNDEADVISASSGDDILTGGLGNDRLTGGTGADLFIYTAATDSDLITGIDRITDFETGTDKIDLSAFLSGAAFISNAAFSGTGAEVRYNAATGRLSGDVDGDGVADFAVLIVNNAAITAGDLIL